MTLHERIAQALGWPLRDVQSMSLQALRELLRPGHPKLVHEIDLQVQSHSVIRGKRRDPRRARSRARRSDPRPEHVISGLSKAEWSGLMSQPLLAQAAEAHSDRARLLRLLGRSPERGRVRHFESTRELAKLVAKKYAGRGDPRRRAKKTRRRR